VGALLACICTMQASTVGLLDISSCDYRETAGVTQDIATDPTLVSACYRLVAIS
jgi:hypothetical protein